MDTRPLLIVLAALAGIAVAAAALGFAKPELFAASVSPDPIEPTSTAADPFDSLPGDLARMLVRPEPDAPRPFVRLARVKPEAFCKNLSAAGLKTAAFQAAETPMRSWTCVSDLVKPVEGDDTTVSSLFVAVRGQDAGRVDSLRMKLNLLDPKTAPAVKAVARSVFDEICRSLGWPAPPQVVDALLELRQGVIVDHGISYDLRKEFGETPRYNLIISFPRTLGPGGEDRFLTDPRRAPVLR